MTRKRKGITALLIEKDIAEERSVRATEDGPEWLPNERERDG